MCDTGQTSTWLDTKNSETFVNQLLDNFVNYIEDILEHLTLAIVFYVILSIISCFFVMKWKIWNYKNGVKNPKRVLIVTAHPDDECMFFGPTILNLRREKDCTIYLMCLSTGSNYGMGKTRKNELYSSCKVLGVKDEGIMVQNHEDLPDDIQRSWPEETVAGMILKHVETFNITTLITFDRYGVSSHPNHFSIYYAVAHLSLGGDLPKGCKVYVLETVNIFRKYWSFLDLPLSYLMSKIRYVVSCSEISIIKDAMRQHRSQMVWFRKIYLMFSRYVVINTLQEMNTSDIELDLSISD